MNLCYQWFLQSEAVGQKIEVMLHHSDLYIMSELATGFNWKTRKTLTLRHAAGGPKYTKLKVASAATTTRPKAKKSRERAQNVKCSSEENVKSNKKRAKH